LYGIVQSQKPYLLKQYAKSLKDKATTLGPIVTKAARLIKVKRSGGTSGLEASDLKRWIDKSPEAYVADAVFEGRSEDQQT
jgi:hypothetical protein